MDEEALASHICSPQNLTMSPVCVYICVCVWCPLYMPMSIFLSLFISRRFSQWAPENLMIGDHTLLLPKSGTWSNRGIPRGRLVPLFHLDLLVQWLDGRKHMDPPGVKQGPVKT